MLVMGSPCEEYCRSLPILQQTGAARPLVGDGEDDALLGGLACHHATAFFEDAVPALEEDVVL